MGKQYYDKTMVFQRECEKYPLKVKRLEQLLDAGIDINSLSNDPEESKSILANLIEEYSFNFGCDLSSEKYEECEKENCEGCEHDCSLYHGEALHELIRFFIDHGFDVQRFGAECLFELCFSTYDNWVLLNAELLIENGADLNGKDEDGDTVLDWVGWKLGDWYTGSFRSGNLFCAFYEMVKAAMNGDEFHGIRDFDVCIGHKVTRIEKIIIDETAQLKKDDEQVRFHEGLLIWCDDMPLYVNKIPEFYVCPIKAEKAQNRIDVSDQFARYIGAEIEELYFVDAGTALIRFRGIADTILFGYCKRVTYEKSYGYLCASREIDRNILQSASVERLLFSDCKGYGDKVTQYSEEIVILKTNVGTFAMYSEGEHYRRHELKMYELPEIVINGQYRELCFDSIHVERYLYEDDGTWRGIVFRTEAGYLTFETDTFNEMSVGLTDTQPEKRPGNDFDKSLKKMHFRYVTIEEN